jgi:carotenoid 1,2-hydratase
MALTLIAMLGSVFSPFYFAARAAGGGVADPLAHSAVNVALYTSGGDQWALTERGERSLSRRPDELVVGPSTMRWAGTALVVEFDERTALLGKRLAGSIHLFPEQRGGAPVALDSGGRHRWQTIAPAARAEVEICHPSPLRFSGAAYLDSNGGDEPLEDAFVGWTWSRVASRTRAAVTYDVERRDGSRLLVTRSFDPGGRIIEGFPLKTVAARPTRWRMPRLIHGDDDARPQITRTLEDTPFYARSLFDTRILGDAVQGTHEALSLGRFRNRLVQIMLPFRMRRERA